MTIFGLAELFKRWTGSTRFDRTAIWRLIFQKVWKIETWNLNAIFIEVFNSCYLNLESISMIVWKLYVFHQRRNFGKFQQFFHHDFRLRWKFWILMVSSERSSSDLSEYILFELKMYFFIYKNIFVWERTFGTLLLLC